MPAINLIVTTQPPVSLTMTGPDAPPAISITTPPALSIPVNEYAPGTVTEDGVQSLSDKTLLDPKLDDAILDAAGAVLLQASATASAVNYVTIFNAATGNSPGLTVGGAAADADLLLTGKGAGVVKAGGYEVLTTNTGVTPSGAQMLTNKTLTSPKITGSVLDANGNEVITLVSVASAVNEVSISNAATGNGVKVSATGGDSAVALLLESKGGAGVKADGSLVRTVGKETINIPAGAWKARGTNGAAPGSVETTTHKLMISTLDFDSAAVEYAQCDVQMPASWDGGTVTAVFCWSHAATTTNFGVALSLAGVAMGNGDALDAARGTAQTVTDTGGATDTLYITAETAAVTIAGSPSAGDFVKFEIARQVANGSDTMAIDARVHSVQIRYTTNASNDN